MCGKAATGNHEGDNSFFLGWLREASLGWLVLHLKGKRKREGGCWGGEMGSSPHKGWRAKGQGWVIVAGAPGVFSSEGGVKVEASCFSPDLFSWRNTFKNTLEIFSKNNKQISCLSRSSHKVNLQKQSHRCRDYCPVSLQ